MSRRQISKDRVGDCDWEKRIIRVRYDQPEREFIDTLIHEIEHGKTLLHFSSERWVTQVSSEVTQVLLRAGIGRK